ncbi:MAG: RNA polymerase sigma factor [Phycisphaerales bacterium JB047]
MDDQRINEGIVSAAIKGDREALSLLWDDSRRWVAAIVLAYKPREADLDDLLQQIAMQLCRKISTLDDPRAFRGWLRTMAINLARAEGRKTTRRKRSMLRLVGMLGGTGSPDERVDELAQASEESRRIYHAARSLPAGYREPVLLRCMQSMSYEQISDAMGLPVTTIETRIARGRRMLREMLAQQKKHEESQHRAVLQGSATGGAP